MTRVWIAALAASVACTGARRSESPSPVPSASAAQAPAQPPTATAPKDSVTLERERYVAEVRKSIAGKEQLPAGEVFKNVKMNPQMPAARLLAVMNIGYGRSLGVSCTHCHVPGQWDSDAKTQKQTARDMSAMVARINGELLKGIPNLKGPNAIVNCTTCHRGQVKPALDMQ
jgi:hypothetical protein